MRKHIKRFIGVLCAVFIASWSCDLAAFAQAEESELQYSYDTATKTVTVTGTGSMEGKFLQSRGYVSPLYKRYLEAEKVVVKDACLVGSAECAFGQMANLKEIVFENVDTSQVTSMRWMFGACTNLKKVDLHTLDTSNVTNMGYLFSACESLEEANLSGLNTAKVTNFGNMFTSCRSIKSVDLSSFDISKNRNVDPMFNGCWCLRSIKAPSVVSPDTPYNIGYLYVDENGQEYEAFTPACSGKLLKKSEVKTAYEQATRTLTITGAGCIEGRKGNSHECVDSPFLETYPDVEKIIVKDARLLEAGSRAFANLEKVKEIEFVNVSMPGVLTISGMFTNCYCLEKVNLQDVQMDSVGDMTGLFQNCKGLKEISLEKLNTAKVFSFNGMFAGCESLLKLDLSHLDTSLLTDCGQFLDGCSSLADLQLTNFKTENVQHMSWMFRGCKALKNLDLSGFKTDSVTTMIGMLEACTGLETLDISSFDLRNVSYCEDMLKGDTIKTIKTPKAMREGQVIYLDQPYEDEQHGVFMKLSESSCQKTLTRCIQAPGSETGGSSDTGNGSNAGSGSDAGNGSDTGNGSQGGQGTASDNSSTNSGSETTPDNTQNNKPGNTTDNAQENKPGNTPDNSQGNTSGLTPENNYDNEKDYRYTIPVSQAGNKVAAYQGCNFYEDINGNIRCYKDNGVPVINEFKCDGTYTYYFQLDGTCMKNRLTYHPDGEHVIYLDENGHEVFSNFANVKQTISGQAVDDFCFFDVYGYLYVDVVTFDQTGTKLYYANQYGVMERNKWFEFSDTCKWADGNPFDKAGGKYGYAMEDGSLMTNTATYDWEGRLCYMQGNGVAKY